MADQAEIFENNEQAKDLVAELVGEGKKYKSVEDLARGRLEADIHIAKVEKEAKELREKLASAKAIEDVLEAVKASSANEQTPQKSDNTPAPTQGMSADQIAKIVAEQVNGLETQKTRTANRVKANAKMQELFGEKAQEVYLKVANTPELQSIYKELAEVDPEKFVSMFHKETPQKQVVDEGTRNSANLNVNVGSVQPGTQAFYSKLRREDPKKYYSPAIQLQMHADAMANPDKYFGRTK